VYSENTFQVFDIEINPKKKRFFLKTNKQIDSTDSVSLIDSQLNFASNSYSL